LAEKLTPQQHQAVHNRGGKLLVSAAAGSGKTKVLVDRILDYLTDPVNPANLDEFLIITYTKAAASELRGKIAAKLTERIAQDPENKHLQKQIQRLFLTKISTVHSFCADILREYAYKLDIAPDFRVADESESRELREAVMSDLLDEAYKTIGSDPDLLSFVDSQGLGRDDRFVPEILEKVYDSARCHLNPSQWLDSCLENTCIPEDADILESIWGQYLIRDLREYLSLQIRIFRDCLRQLEAADGMEKPAANIHQTLRQLEALQAADSWDAVSETADVDYGRLTFPRKNADPELTERVKAARNACKKGLEKKLQNFSDSTRQILMDFQQSNSGMRGLIHLVRQFDRNFSAVKRSRRILDFSDLEQKTLDLLLGKSRNHPSAAAREIGSRFREIMVDEYQDSNGVQDAIFDALTRQKQNCFMVGDVKQSIYQFRLADPGIFLEKYHTYQPAEAARPGEGRRVLLSHNFRSGPEIIECANSVFQAAMSPEVGGLTYGESEMLREGIPQEPLPDKAVELYAIDVREDTYSEEAAFVAGRIQQMLQNKTLIRKNGILQPVAPEDIVILLRSPGTAAGCFQKALEARGIRCTTGAGADLLKAEEIITLRSLLQVIMNPRQDIPLITALAGPVFGFTADDLALVRSGSKKGTFYDALCLSNLDKAIHFREILQQLRKEAKMGTLTALLESCFRLTRLDTIYGAMADGGVRSANLQMFYQLASDYEKQSLKDLPQFLDYLSSVEDRGLVVSGSSPPDAVTIMSIHKSKGLEFPVVFLCNLSRRFNMESLRAQILCDKQLGLGLSIADSQKRIRYPSLAKRAISVKMASESISEEMRVLYVAMTRPRDRLIMTYASGNLESDLSNIVLRQDFDSGELVCREATCMGDWVLLAALKRTEAGALHAISGRPGQTHISRHPWLISVCQATGISGPVPEEELPETPGTSQEQFFRIRAGLSFRYPHLCATRTPSKQTATSQKGRDKDLEVTDKTPEPPAITRKWRSPVFLTAGITGKEFGNVMHTVMQYIDYHGCNNLAGIQNELSGLVESGFLTQEQADSVNPEKIRKLFASPLGKKLADGTSCLREFKFSILNSGSRYDPSLEGEQVLVQGVVDCALLEEDGITVIDFKTDFATEDTVAAIVERYRPQVHTYAEALARIYEKPVKASYLYLFHLDRFVPV